MGMAFNIVGMFIAIYAIDKYGLQVSRKLRNMTLKWNREGGGRGEWQWEGTRTKKGRENCWTRQRENRKSWTFKKKSERWWYTCKTYVLDTCMWCWFRFHLVRIQISLFAKGIRSRSKPHLCDWFRIEAKWRGSRSFAIKFTLKL